MPDSIQNFSRWPLPLWNLRWTVHDGVRRDLVLGWLIGTLVGFYLSTSTSWKEGAWKVGVPFAVCAAIQLVYGFVRLFVLIDTISKQKYGGLKIVGGFLAVPFVLIAAVLYPFLGLIIALCLLLLRLATLAAREDSDLLIAAAATWLIWLGVATLLFHWTWICIATSGLIGFFMASTTADLGYRFTRWLNALRESTTLVFGIVLAGVSVVRTLATVSVSSPGASHLQGHGAARSTDALMTSTVGTNPGSRMDIIPVRGYVRSVPVTHLSGGHSNVFGSTTQYIAPHVRTLPDGILENNLSYRPRVQDVVTSTHPPQVDGVSISTTPLPGIGGASDAAIPLLLICQGIASFSAPSDPRIRADFRLRRWGRLWRLADWVA